MKVPELNKMQHHIVMVCRPVNSFMLASALSWPWSGNKAGGALPCFGMGE